ncbi:MAG: type II toxin-antitoxin system prevent-host-death family antitoxin [Candidatus Thiothrix singaporensis]|uniref:Type II toxin-antitoxin system prevent-host-death family antitoxin n=1 Tax=Candidatus Thiothrix singaporensis TaxID=2799669 RepID=A0A7L6ASJ2_9GAMM|nr:MAG: type II toxin-antitoxin system prevent-host-death family antitoxin [Candidatus Thiothrix singaporensis]
MQVLPAAEIKNRFGRVSNIVKSGEPVTITQYGEPTMMLLPSKLRRKHYGFITPANQARRRMDCYAGWKSANRKFPRKRKPFPLKKSIN